MIIDANKLGDTKKRVYEYLVSVDSDFTPVLSSKVKLDEYTDKIMSLGNVFVYTENGKIGAMIIFYTNDKETLRSYCAALSVAHEFRGRGLSKQLLSLFIEKSRECGMLTASCHTSNPVVEAMCKASGFVEKGREKSAVKDIGDRIFLEKTL